MNWERLRELVEEAADRPAAERSAWLREACGGDAALLAEAEALLAAAQEDLDFLEPPSLRREPIAAGDWIGPFEIVRPIAEGGMGTVYEASQRDPERRVAIKVMRSGLLTAASADRFRYEATVLAALRHPSIAHIYQTGVQESGDRELLWFAMEFIENARPIVAYAEERQLPVAERLRLFAEVCDAVHHGHTKGILHRDLKPDNILVDGDGRPKVIDFGIARAADVDLAVTAHTGAGELVGTLSHMSPEQVSGNPERLETRSDVYSLGVVLYELLTSELPYSLAGLDLPGILRAIADRPPRKPSEVRPEIRGDLETILLECLAKDPEQRYASAAALGRDLRRYLAHQPIEARPPSVRYQLRLFARRHRGLVAALAAVFLVAIVGAVVSGSFAITASRAERTATDERDRSRALFRSLLDRSVSATVNQVPRVTALPGGAEAAIEIARGAIADLESLGEMGRSDPEVRRRIAWAYLRLGGLQGDPSTPNQLGELKRALETYGHALTIADALYAQDPDDENTRLYATALMRRGHLERYEREFDAAREKLQRAVELFQGLREQRGDETPLLEALHEAHGKFAEFCARTNAHAERARHQRSRLELATLLVEREPENPKQRLRYAEARGAMAAVHLVEDRPVEAIGEFDVAIGLLEKLVAEDPANVTYRLPLAYNLLHAAIADRERGEWERAVERHGRSLEMYLALHEQDPRNAHVPIMVGMSYWSLGQTAEGHARKAGEPERRRSLEIARDAYHDAWRFYADLKRDKKLESHGGFVERCRTRFEACRKALGES